ncbi:MAG TPA: tyrosine-type recombinase/integrase [Acidimicrobiales bacterium]|nr:tyrosine-type recombinase/integrase [Acidimicrobiales bacterium]
MSSVKAPPEGRTDNRGVQLQGAAHLVLSSGVTPLHPQEAVFEAMLVGWTSQQRSRCLSSDTIGDRLRLIRRFAAFTNEFPWHWTASDVEDWTVSLGSGLRPASHSTVRTYQQGLAMFMGYLCDARYGWAIECENRFGTHPVQICHEWNTVSHLADYEGRPGNRPFSRPELQRFFDYADDQVGWARELGRKGWIAAFRDATLFKVAYAWGLRRQEVARLDLVDFGPNAAAPELGGYGMLCVRWGKATKGGPPRRRNVCTVMPWAAAALEEYVAEIRPLYGLPKQPALWPTERGGRVSTDYVNHRFAAYRADLDLPGELGPHCLRHSYVTHLIEDGFDPLFVQQQVGHLWASTTALYTGVSNDYKNRMIRSALERAFSGPEESHPDNGGKHP